MFFQVRGTIRWAGAVAAVALSAGPASATDDAITDAMLDTHASASIPSPLAGAVLSPLGPLIFAVAAARNARIHALKAKIAELENSVKESRKKIKLLRIVKAYEKALNAGVPVSKKRSQEAGNAAKQLDQEDLNRPNRAIRYTERFIREDQERLDRYKTELRRLEAQSVASSASGNFTQSVPLSFASHRAASGQLTSNAIAKQGLSLNGTSVREFNLSGDGSEAGLQVRGTTGVNHTSYDQNSMVNRRGHSTSVWAGLHFALGDDHAAGIYGTYSNGEDRLSTFNSSLDSERFGIGGYFTMALGEALIATLRMEYHGGDHDIAIGTTRGNFNTDMVALQGKFTGRFPLLTGVPESDDVLARAWIEPTAALSFSHVDRDAYTLSNGFVVAAGDLHRARLSAGPRIGSTVLGDGDVINLIEPYVQVQGIWDFANQGNLLVAAGTRVKTPDVGGLVGGGVEMALLNNATLKIESNYAFFETDFEAWNISGTASIPLHSLGVTEAGSAGLLSFQVNAVPSSSSASVQLNLPLN